MNRKFRIYSIFSILILLLTTGSDLSIDAILNWNTFLGGNSSDQGYGITIDVNGYIYVSGVSNATWGLPLRNYSGGSSDAFVAKLDGSGNLIWNTFLGGGGQDVAHANSVDANGNVYVVGYSDATWGIPIRPYLGDYDVFAAKVDTDGNLIWNTFLGSADQGNPNKGDTGHDIAVDGSMNVYVVGKSWDTWGSPIRPHEEYRDAFAAMLDDAGNLVWNTFLGSDGDDFGNGITADQSGNSYVSGQSCGTWGSPVNPYAGWCDGFASRLDSDGNLVWNTFLGCSGDTDSASGIAVSESDVVFLVGFSSKTWGSPVRSFSNEDDAYAARLDSDGNLVWHTFLGGSENDYGYEITGDGNGNSYVVGYSRSSWGTPIDPFIAEPDAFTAGLDSGGHLVWNTFLTEYGFDVVMDSTGNLYLTGTSGSSFGTPIRSYSGSGDAFVVKMRVIQLEKLYLPLIIQ